MTALRKSGSDQCKQGSILVQLIQKSANRVLSFIDYKTGDPIALSSWFGRPFESAVGDPKQDQGQDNQGDEHQ